MVGELSSQENIKNKNKQTNVQYLVQFLSNSFVWLWLDVIYDHVNRMLFETIAFKTYSNKPHNMRI